MFAQAIVIFYPGVLVFWLIVHNNIDRLRPLGIRAYWVAALAWAVTSGPLIYFRRDIFSVRWLLPHPLDRVLAAIGILALTFAALFLFRASRQISMRIMIGLPEVEPKKNKQRVLNSGIYSRTRNPIYFGHWLLVFSAAAMTSFAANWIGFALDCIFLPLLIRAEERELLVRHGRDFAEYMRTVPRFFPRVIQSGLSRTARVSE
jgi:protein-S-isoprenylcysteine O-methyltransferase Ste14